MTSSAPKHFPYASIRRGRLWLAVGMLASSAACLAPPPPIVLETPYGNVRANSVDSASEVADLLIDLTPRVRAILPGAQSRPVDVWVQRELQVYRFQKRPESVRGFTLLEDEFHARRIHLQDSGQSPWYLSHELVHALIDSSWSTLPGILEEGLADVIAEQLNARDSVHIRAHRLLNASAFSGGLQLRLVYHRPDPLAVSPPGPAIVPSITTGDDTGVGGGQLSGLEHASARRPGSLYMRSVVLRLNEIEPVETALALLSTKRRDLHQRWDALPESFYGIAWLMVSRIGIDRLHALCQRASEEGHDLIPVEWILAAADMDLDSFTPEFLGSCFGRKELKHAIHLQPHAFASAAREVLLPLGDALRPDRYFPEARPAFYLEDGTRIPLETTGAMMEDLLLHWPGLP